MRHAPIRAVWIAGACWIGCALLGCSTQRPHAAPASARGEFMAQVQRHLAEREYHATENGRGLQAPNRRHNLRSYFGPEGIRVVDRTAAGNPELLALSLARYGRDGSQHDVPEGVLRHHDARVEIARGDALIEWYENGPAGLEQGFILAARPPGNGAVELEIAVTGAHIAARGNRLEFHSESGRRLRYDKLHVEDARGTVLAAHFAPDDASFRIVVDDRGALYPVVIDPLLSGSFEHEIESNQIDANLGTDVASAGDVDADGYADVLVSAQSYDSGETNEGAAWVFLGGPGGIGDGNPLNADAQLEANQAESRFGFSIASAGDVNGDGYDDVIVGAYRWENPSDPQSDEGGAFVFHGGPAGIASGNPGTADAVLESDQAGAALGVNVSGAGDVNGDGYADVIVGAWQFDDGQSGEGAAWIFHGSASGIVAAGSPANADTELQGNQSSARFGRNVAAAGDVNGDGFADVIVGAYEYDVNGTDDGAAFVFHGSAIGIADADADAADGILDGDQTNGEVGLDVGGAGDVNGDGYSDVIVGATLYDAGETNEGAAFVFHGGPGGVGNHAVSAADAQLESDQGSAQFGLSVNSAGDVNGDGYADVIVGAQTYDSGETNEGVALVFLGSAGGVVGNNPATAYAQLEVDQASASMGRRVASAGDVNGDGYADVIVGAAGFDGPQSGEGSAFLYHGGADGIVGTDAASAHAQLESDQAFAGLGESVASTGDVNGDGYGDVIVGAPGFDAGEDGEGAAFIVLGSPTGIDNAGPGGVHALLESDQAGASFGMSVATAGDVNGDGYADVVVGAFAFDGGETDEGAAFVFLGSPAGIADGDPTSAHAQLESDQDFARMGHSVASAGDVNGDGYADVIVGASGFDAGESAEGAAFVFLGSPAGIADGNPASAHAQLESDQDFARMGESVASAGDVNGDGYADIIVGARNFDAGASSEGAAFVFLGSPAGVADGNPANAHAQLESDQVNAELGTSVASAGDVNGDGYGDVIVGAPDFDTGESGKGAAFVFLGSPAGIANGNPGSAHAQLDGDPGSGEMGGSVASAGDVNGDGYGDIIIGDPSFSAGESFEGGAFVFLGSPAGIADGNSASAHAQLESDQADALFGTMVNSAGDVNGDGYTDVIVGARLYDSGNTQEGAAFIFLGNSEGRPTLSQQRRGDASGIPVQPGGLSVASGAFQVELFATSPRGRELGKLDVEVCPHATPFGDVSCTSQTSATWTDLGTSGALLAEDLTGLTDGVHYNWRARVLYAPSSATQPGITPNPRAGPWRRFAARGTPGDILLLPEPGLGIGLPAGLLAVAALRRRRASRIGKFPSERAYFSSSGANTQVRTR